VNIIVKKSFKSCDTNKNEFFVPTGSTLTYVSCTYDYIPYYDLKTYKLVFKLNNKNNITLYVKGYLCYLSNCRYICRTQSIDTNYHPTWNDVMVNKFSDVLVACNFQKKEL